MAALVSLIIGAIVFLWIISRARGQDEPNTSNVIRINEERPRRMSRKLGYNIKVAGISRRVSVATDFIRGMSQRLELEREPDNLVDANAVKVIGIWLDGSSNIHREQLGYVPREAAALIGIQPPDFPLVATLQVMFPPARDRSPGIRFDIWTKRDSQKRK